VTQPTFLTARQTLYFCHPFNSTVLNERFCGNPVISWSFGNDFFHSNKTFAVLPLTVRAADLRLLKATRCNADGLYDHKLLGL
jgi:hypothetical protein